MFALTGLLLALLSGCFATSGAEGVMTSAGGTAVSIEGELCGKPVKIQVADINDRAQFVGKCFDPTTGNPVLEISTAERGASSAIEAMAEASRMQAGAFLCAAERLQYEPLVSSLFTSAVTAEGVAAVGWTISSNVDPVAIISFEAKKELEDHQADGTGSEDQPVYRYTYTFENTSSVAVRLNLSDPRVANSPLTEIFQDFSFTLLSRQKRTVQFLAARDPALVVSPVNNAIWNDGEWGPLGTRPASLYIPAWSGRYFEQAGR